MATDSVARALAISALQGTGGTPDYNDLVHKPSINDVTLNGNKTSSDLGLQAALEAGNGINISGDIVTAVAKSSDKYIEVTSAGIASKGIDAAIEDAIEELDVTDTAADDKYVSAVNEEDGKVIITRANIPVTGAKSAEKVIAIDGTEITSTLSINYDSESRKVQLKGISGTLVSEFDASAFIKDGMLYGEIAFVADATSKTVTVKGQSHTFTNLLIGHQYLALVFTDGDVTPTYSWEIIDLQDLVDIYTAGDGLTLDDHEFAINIDNASETFLTVGASGLKLSGVDTAIDNAVDAEEDRATEAEDALDTRIKAFEENGAHDVAALEDRVDTAEDDIAAIEAKPAYTITNVQVSNWDNEVGAKVLIAAETSRADAAERQTAGALAQEIIDRGAADTSLGNRITAIENKEDEWDAKQDALTAGSNITITDDVISAVDTTYTAGTNVAISSSNVISATDTTYTAGENVSISAGNVISATDTTYTAGTNITIDEDNEISATDTTYTAGTGINISASNVISIDRSVIPDITTMNSAIATAIGNAIGGGY